MSWTKIAENKLKDLGFYGGVPEGGGYGSNTEYEIGMQSSSEASDALDNKENVFENGTLQSSVNKLRETKEKLFSIKE